MKAQGPEKRMAAALRALAWGCLAACLAGGCERTPADMAALREGTRLEAQGDFEGAEAKYLEASALGNDAAFRQLAGMMLSREGTAIFLETKARDEAWVSRAHAFSERLAALAAQGVERGCPLEEVQKALKGYRQVIAETEERLAKERAAEEERLAKERAAMAAAARAEAERKRQEEAEAAARRAAEKAEAERRAAEEARRNSADYCIENGILLTEGAFREVCRAMTYHQNTGNTLVDDEENERQHARFRGKRVVLGGRIAKVDGKFFGGVKIKLEVCGQSVWANFPNMSEGEGKRFMVGRYLEVEGKVESAMFNPFNLGQCEIQ